MNKSDILKKDEKEWVELPFLNQLKGLGWECIELTKSQVPTQSYRESFSANLPFPSFISFCFEINCLLINLKPFFVTFLALKNKQ